MIITALAKQVAYRMHTPKWAHLPTSGAGAAKAGGRLNRPGVDALYLSFEIETTTAEYQQLGSLLPPGTLVTYQVTIDKVVDFSAGYTAAWDPLWQDLHCDWRKLAFNDKVEPPSWVLGDLAMADGCKGIIFPSAIRPGGRNLVVFTGMLTAGDQLAVYDPHGDLPQNAASGPAKPSP
jgi:RES domain-containing protein